MSGTSQTFLDIHGSDAQNVWAVGYPGLVARWNGSAWAAQYLSTGQLYGVSVTGPQEAWAVGISGLIWRWDGARWSQQPSGVNDILHDVFALRRDALFAVSDSGTTLGSDGSSWKRLANSGDTTALYSVWGSDEDNIWAVGDSGVIRKWDGSGWTTQPSGITTTLYGIWGTSKSEVYAVGVSGQIPSRN